MIQLSSYVTRNKLTNAQAAILFGVSEVRVADLLRGDINNFELSSLISMATAANLPLEMLSR